MKRIVENAVLSAEMRPDKVGVRITALRKSLHLSKAQFADMLEYDRSSLTKVENGTKGLDIFVGARIADMFGAGLDYIYRGVISDVPQEMRADIVAEIHAARSSRQH